jgi:prepilin-type N-terminal cleavage/methylation domain-containing protein
MPRHRLLRPTIHDQRGFTLIELLLVLAITGALASTDAVVAGVGFELDNDHPDDKLEEIEPVYCNPDDCPNTYSDAPAGDLGRCPRASSDGECFEEFFGSTDLNLVGHTNLELVYLNTPQGVRICEPIIDNSPGSIKDACANSGSGPPITFEVTDRNGFKATIELDVTSGIPRRRN